MQEETLTVAHVGDSRGVLCRAGTAVELTKDHKPELEQADATPHPAYSSLKRPVPAVHVFACHAH